MNTAKKALEPREREPQSRRDRFHMHKRRLETINARLGELGLAQLSSVGDYKRGEFELKEIVGEHNFIPGDGNPTYFWIIVFSCYKPDGTDGYWAMLFNRDAVEIPREGQRSIFVSGALCITTVNSERMVLVRQHRPTQGKWTTEIPRGYNPSGVYPISRLPKKHSNQAISVDPAALKISEIPLGIAGVELAPLIVGRRVEVERFSLLGIAAENPGNTPNQNLLFHLNLVADGLDSIVGEVKGTDSMKLLFPTFDDIDENWQGELELTGTHCTSALWYFDKLVRPHLRPA